jgi:serine/threonine protein kinase
MRLVRGGSLRNYQKKLNLEQIARITEQIGSALTIAHRENVIHQDIKPDNILMDHISDCAIVGPLKIKQIKRVKIKPSFH